MSDSLQSHGLYSYQAPSSMVFSRQEYCSGLPFPSPEDLPDLGIQLRSPALQADSLSSEPRRKPETLQNPELNLNFRDLPSNPVVETSPSNAGGTGSIPGWGTKVPHVLKPKKINKT